MSRRPRCRETGKIMFPTNAIAQDALARCVKQRVLQHVTRRMERDVYLCGHCDAWHLTSQQRRPARRSTFSTDSAKHTTAQPAVNTESLGGAR